MQQDPGWEAPKNAGFSPKTPTGSNRFVPSTKAFTALVQEAGREGNSAMKPCQGTGVERGAWDCFSKGQSLAKGVFNNIININIELIIIINFNYK